MLVKGQITLPKLHMTPDVIYAGEVASYEQSMFHRTLSQALAPRGVKAAVARHFDIDPSTVSKWASGGTRPELWRWSELEELTGLEPGTLALADADDSDAAPHPWTNETAARLDDELARRRIDSGEDMALVGQLFMEAGRLEGRAERRRALTTEPAPLVEAKFPTTGRRFLFDYVGSRHINVVLQRFAELLYSSWRMGADASTQKVLVMGEAGAAVNVDQGSYLWDLLADFTARHGVLLLDLRDVLAERGPDGHIFDVVFSEEARALRAKYALAADADTLEGEAPERPATRPGPESNE
jgi:hypothetical protein